MASLKRNVYTVAVVGDAGVGKTCLINKLCYGSIPSYYEPTIEDLHTAIVMTEKLEIIDTSSEQMATPFRRAAFQQCHAVVFVYDIQNLESTFSLDWQLDELRSVYQWQDVSQLPVVCLVVGLKKHVGPSDEHAVFRGERFAHVWGMEHVTATLQSTMSVRGVFEKCVFLIEEKAANQHKETKTSCCTIL